MSYLCEDVSRCVILCEYVSRCVILCQDVSICVTMCHNVSQCVVLCVILCHIVSYCVTMCVFGRPELGCQIGRPELGPRIGTKLRVPNELFIKVSVWGVLGRNVSQWVRNWASRIGGPFCVNRCQMVSFGVI